MSEHELSERDICTRYITPAIQKAGWPQHAFREEVQLTDGRVAVRGNLAARIKNPDAKGGPKRADYVLYLQAKGRCAANNPVAKERLENAARQIHASTRQEAELSAVARWCVLFRNDRQLVR